MRSYLALTFSAMGSNTAIFSSPVTLTFSVLHSVAFGERIYIIGSATELGEWEVASAVPLKWHTGDVWSVSLRFTAPSSSAPTRVEYKFVVAAASGPEDGPGPPLWEPGHNHAVDLAPGVLSAQLSHEWGDAASHDILPTENYSIVLGGNSVDHALAASFCSPPPTPARIATDVGHNDPVSLAAERLASDSASASITAIFRVDIPVKHRNDIVYVVGSVPSLGSWNKAHSPRMRPLTSPVDDTFVVNDQNTDHSGGEEAFDQWELSLSLPVNDRHRLFEYKYLIRERGLSGERFWEPGPNRVASLGGDTSVVLWRDRWDRIRWEFSIFYPTRFGNVMHVTGDPVEIGGWFKPGPVPLKLGPVERIETDVDGRKWRLTVWLPCTIKTFAYRYMCYDPELKTSLWEREPNRVANMTAIVEHGRVANGGFENHVDIAVNGGRANELRGKETLPVNSVCLLRDVNFVAGLEFDAVPPKMFIGPYPQTASDIDAIASGGATAVLNLQTDEDFAHRGIRWDDLLRHYARVGVVVVRFPIRDFDRDSLASRIKEAVHELDRLISDGNDVYIHCTAGMGRAPAVAVAYLCLVHNYKLDDAVAHVKKHRAVAVPNVPVLRTALGYRN